MKDPGLRFRQFSKQLVVFFWRDIPDDLCGPLSLEVFCDEFFEIQMKIILNKLQCGVVILYHQIGVFAYDVDLLDFLL